MMKPEPPKTPRVICIKEVTENSAVIHFQKETSLFPIIKYEIIGSTYHKDHAFTKWETILETDETSADTLCMKNLKPGSNYMVKLYAYNIHGKSKHDGYQPFKTLKQIKRQPGNDRMGAENAKKRKILPKNTMVCPYCNKNLEHYKNQAVRSVHFSKCKKEQQQQEQRRRARVEEQALKANGFASPKASLAMKTESFSSHSSGSCNKKDNKFTTKSEPVDLAESPAESEANARLPANYTYR